jgi:hypothetical protein
MPVKDLKIASPETMPAASQGQEAMTPLPEKHVKSLNTTLKIAEMVGRDLEVIGIDSVEDIPKTPGVYLFRDEVDHDHYSDIRSTEFKLKRECLSGRIDSAHAVLPGTLDVVYSNAAWNREIPIAAKGFYEKRTFAERFERVKKEVVFSMLQEEQGEIAFAPLAVAIAPPAYKGKSTDYTDYNIVLISRLNKANTLDNNGWQLGFNEDNLEGAEAAANALGKFNQIGKHGDAKIKNVAQLPSGEASMIDFETSELVDLDNPTEAAEVATEDFGTFLDSLQKRGFFDREPYRSHEVMDALGETYLAHWANRPEEVQEKVFTQVAEVIEMQNRQIIKKAGSNPSNILASA